MTPWHFALMLLIVIVWAGNLIVMKLALEVVPPFAFTTLRFMVLMLLLGFWLRPVKGQMRGILIVALSSGAIHFGLLFIGLRMADGITSVAVALQLNVPFATLVGWLWLGEKFGWRRALGIALAFVGTVIIAFDPNVLSYAGAFILVMLAALAYAIAATAMRGMRNVGVLTLQAWVAVFSWPPLMALSYFVEDWQSIPFSESYSLIAWSLAFSVLGASILGHGGTYYLLQRYEVNKVLPFTLLVPVVAAVMAAWIFGETVTAGIAIGGLVTLAGVAIVIRRQRMPAQTIGEGG